MSKNIGSALKFLSVEIYPEPPPLIDPEKKNME
jgi:hypothetical protein